MGGVLGDIHIRRPFEVAFFLYIVSTIYGALFLPESTQGDGDAQKQPANGVAAFFAPLRIIRPHRYRLKSGQVIKNHGLVFLALGIFLGVVSIPFNPARTRKSQLTFQFASGYAPILLQMYATSEFNFRTTENGYLMFGNSLIRGLFLLLMFPKIIASGREWYNGTPHTCRGTQDRQGRGGDEDGIPTHPEDFDIAESGVEVPQEPVRAPDAEEEDSGTGFDLLFVRWSLVVDSLVTFFAGFSSHGWQVYLGKRARAQRDSRPFAFAKRSKCLLTWSKMLAGFLLPFASGSAPAAKGVMTEMTPPHSRRDALSGITLVESSATLMTQGLFGLIYAAFSEIGHPSLTFFCNTVSKAIGALLGPQTLFLQLLTDVAAGFRRARVHCPVHGPSTTG